MWARILFKSVLTPEQQELWELPKPEDLPAYRLSPTSKLKQKISVPLQVSQITQNWTSGVLILYEIAVGNHIVMQLECCTKMLVEIVTMHGHISKFNQQNSSVDCSNYGHNAIVCKWKEYAPPPTTATALELSACHSQASRSIYAAMGGSEDCCKMVLQIVTLNPRDSFQPDYGG